jgi:hypothetical protein
MSLAREVFGLLDDERAVPLEAERPNTTMILTDHILATVNGSPLKGSAV